ncbi:hypothetical protein A9Q78_09645 [Methylophaga sp. 41_12_T18]|nr:hypothetical protein A9Q78_09645 [Methylophaga sp. 41_12_T18]
MTLTADNLFSALSHPMRLRTLILLSQVGELCVCELTYTLDLSQPVISRHLAQLKQAGLLSSRKQGLWVYYQLNNSLPAWAENIIETTRNGVINTSPYQDDLTTLTNMKDRPNQACC